MNRNLIKHEVIVLATMSSGKSTLINALLGSDILPNENQACTAKIFRITDSDEIDKVKVQCIYKDNRMSEESLENLNILNSNIDIKEIEILGDFKGIQNKKIAYDTHQLTLIDTPGPNNSLDLSHGEIAYELVEESDASYLIYVLNATQIGINDDRKLLADILDIKNKSKKNLEVMFLLNKADQIDPQKENIYSIKNNVMNYLENIGFSQPNIMIVSAYAAKLLKNGLEGKVLTRKELFDFKFFYNYFTEHSLTNNNFCSEDQDETIMIKNEEFKKNDILERIFKTGIVDLEKELNNFVNEKIIVL